MPIIILDIIKRDEPDERGLMSSLHSVFGSSWSQRDAKKMLDALIKNSFVNVSTSESIRKFKITKDGIELLVRLRLEYGNAVAKL